MKTILEIISDDQLWVNRVISDHLAQGFSIVSSRHGDKIKVVMEKEGE